VSPELLTDDELGLLVESIVAYRPFPALKAPTGRCRIRHNVIF
jgi:hypothetical protein